MRTNRFLATYRDFSGGINEYVGPFGVADNESPFLKNVQLDKPNILYKGEGYSQAGSGTSSGMIKGVGVFEAEDGTNTLLKLYTTTVSKWNGASWDSIITGLTNNSTDKMEYTNVFLDNDQRVYISTGFNDLIRYWNGTTNGTVSTYYAKHIESFNSSLYLGNVKYSSVEYPNRVIFSTILTDDFDISENFIDVNEPITALKTYAGKLHIFTTSKLYIYDEYALTEVPGDFGTPSARSVQVVQGRMLWYNRSGVYMYAGTGLPTLISRKVDGYIKAIATPTSVAAGIDSKDRYILYLGDITYGGTSYSDACLTYSILDNNWTFRPDSPFGSFVRVKSGGSNLLYAGDVDNDKVWKVDGAQGLNISTTLVSEYQTKRFDANRPEDEKNFYKVYITYKPTGASEYLTVKYRLDGASAWSQIEGTNNNVSLSGTDLISVAELDFPANTQGKFIQLQISHSSVTGGFEIYEIRFECDMLRS